LSLIYVNQISSHFEKVDHALGCGEAVLVLPGLDTIYLRE
jgi:hypothetical protein